MGASTLEKFRLKRTVLVTAMLCLGACSGKFLKVDDQEKLLQPNDEFDRAVKIVVPPSPDEVAAPETAKETATEAAPPKGGAAPEKSLSAGVKKDAVKDSKKPAPKAAAKKGQTPEKKPAKAAAPAGPPKHEPAEVENGDGFVGRRPVVDPFRVGESVVHEVKYLGVAGGTLTFKVDPFGEVNGRKAYNMVTRIETYPTFSNLVYAVDDKVVALMDFDLLVPRVFTLHVKESGQLREARSFYDLEKNEVTYWEKKVTKKAGAEEKKQQWEMLPFSQSVYSAIFYMRLFKWEDGKEYAFRVAHDNENLIFTGKTILRETLDTNLGPMKAVKVKPTITVKGAFKPMGDIYIWLSDDDRRYVLRIEAAIKIGTLYSDVIKIEPGK